jgi:hypothetical protein
MLLKQKMVVSFLAPAQTLITTTSICFCWTVSRNSHSGCVYIPLTVPNFDNNSKTADSKDLRLNEYFGNGRRFKKDVIHLWLILVSSRLLSPKVKLSKNVMYSIIFLNKNMVRSSLFPRDWEDCHYWTRVFELLVKLSVSFFFIKMHAIIYDIYWLNYGLTCWVKIFKPKKKHIGLIKVAVKDTIANVLNK